MSVVSRERDVPGVGLGASRSPDTPRSHARGEGAAWRYDKGCRCTECREAKRIKRKKQRDRSRELNTPSYQRELAVSRALKESYRGTCRNCGRSTTGCDGPGSAPELCRHCAPGVHGRKRRGTGWFFQALREQLETGPKRFQEMRDAIGVSNGYLSCELHRFVGYGLIVRVSRGVYALAPKSDT